MCFQELNLVRVHFILILFPFLHNSLLSEDSIILVNDWEFV